MSEISFTGKSIEDTYKSKDLRGHIYDKPEMYIGAIETSAEETWTYEDGHIKNTIVNFNQGIYKLFDEIISNAVDQHVRTADKIAKGLPLAPVTKIDIVFDEDSISVCNNGTGIDVVRLENGLYVPTMIFGQLLTSGNYDKDEKRITTGQYGLGAKLTNIFSVRFIVETVDHVRKLLFKQEFRDNMKEIGEPIITKYSKVPYTKITYWPDYTRFGIDDIAGADTWKVLTRRVYDFTFYLDKSCNVFLNSEKIKCKTFEDYTNLYLGGNKKEVKRIYSSIGTDEMPWEICVALSPTEEPMQVSFINGCFTDLGGKHVDYLTNLLVKRLIESVKLKKDAIAVKPEHVKKYIWIFIKGTIQNPTFDTQSKRRLTTLYSNFGIKLEFPDEFIKKVSELDIIGKAQKLTNFKTGQALSKKTNGKKVKKIYDPKLLDCEYAGTANSIKAVLIFTEGDSAAGFFKEGRSGLTEEEKRCFACFPLKGKILNTQKATTLKISNNAEITKIKKLIGLIDGKKYDADSIAKELRYGKVMFLADADTDGDHIKGLCMSFIYAGWPELIDLGYICSFPTPLIKVWKKLTNDDDEPDQNKVIAFFSEAEFTAWSLDNPGTGYVHKYYKGLATHSQRETRHCFKNKIITNYYYGHTKPEKQASRDSIEMVFKPKREEDRKEWMLDIDRHPKEEISYAVPTETIKTFIDYRLVKHCKADNIRSIPNNIDGLKPSQRKAIYCFLFGKNKGKAIKVGSLSGSMMQDTGYHHGEMSANETIINLGQNFIGAGNLNLLRPIGIFGTRSLNGKDHGAARYISVGNLSYLDVIFNKTDLQVLKKNYDDGVQIEPEYFVPIVPLVLFTGAEGIGTGWSTSVSCYNPDEIVANLIDVIKGREQSVELVPWYRGFRGKIIKVDTNKYLSLGSYVLVGPNEIKITELPIGSKLSKSFSKYKEFIYSLAGKAEKETKKDEDSESVAALEEGTIQDIVISNEMANEIQINITFREGYLEEQMAENYNYEFEKKFKLALSFSTTNMHLYRHDGIHYYNNCAEIISDFHAERLHVYHLRKDFLIKESQTKLEIARNRYRFVSEIIDETIIIFKKTKAQIVMLLTERGYYAEDGAFDYLLSMQIYSFSKEKLEELRKLCDSLLARIDEITAEDVRDTWINELRDFLDKYHRENEVWLRNINLSDAGHGSGHGSGKAVAKKRLSIKK